MKMKFMSGTGKALLIFAVILTATSALAQTPRKTTLAVMDLTTTGISKSEGAILTDALLSYLVNTNYYEIVERSKRDEILKEQGFAQSGACNETACLIEAGKYLSVQKMVGGSVGKFGETWTVNVRLLDVKTGKVEKACIKNYIGKMDQLLNYMDDISREIVQTTGITKQQIEAFRQKEVADSVTAVKTGIEPTQNNEIVNIIDGSILIEIPAGSFIMGSNNEVDEKPVHKVYLDKYYLGKYEVTVGQFRQFVNATGYKQEQEELIGKTITFGDEKILWVDIGWKAPYLIQSDNCHVVNVGWADAKAYCDWAGLRLPTEAEWEKAARGIDARVYPWGNVGDIANCHNRESGDIYTATSPVGSFLADISPYGCYDMAGNVSEWCNDWYSETYYGISPKKNPQGPSSGDCKVFRGGSYLYLIVDCRSTKRMEIMLDYLNKSQGFRVAK